MAPSGWWQRFSLACHCTYQYPSSPGFICCFARGLGCATLFYLWLCAHLLLGLGFHMLPACPSPSIRPTGSSGYSSPLGFPTFAMGSPLRGRGSLVLDRNEGLVSPFGSGTLVSSWLDFTPLSAASLRALSLRVCCQVVLDVSRASVVLSSLQCSSLSHVRVQCCLHDPCYGSGVVFGTLPYFLPAGVCAGVCASVGGSALRPLSGWFSLKLWVLGGSWFSPLCSPGRRSASRSTCSALPPVSRLSFGLGDFSFGWGFGLCLTILLAPWGCQSACCDPPCGSESARVLPSLLGPSPNGVCHLSRVCSSVGGPVGVAHSFHPSLLLGGGLVRFCDRLYWRSLAMSWAYPPPFLCVGLVDRSRRMVAPLAPCLCWRFPSLVRFSLLRRGVSPCVWFRRGPWGVAVAPPISPYTGPGWSPPICCGPLELRSVFHIFLCDVPHICMAIILSVSLTPECPWLVIPIGWCSLDTCKTSDWMDLLSPSSLFQDSVICADL